MHVRRSLGGVVLVFMNATGIQYFAGNHILTKTYYHHRGISDADSCEGYKTMFMRAKRPAAAIPTLQGVQWDRFGLSISPPGKKWG